MSKVVRGGRDLQQLQGWTEARVGLGRVGASLPTAASLQFSADHAAARDAVHTPMNAAMLAESLLKTGFASTVVRSRASDRMTYLQRPDLGRQLDAGSAKDLHCEPGDLAQQRLTVIVADGLSSEAPARYAVPLLTELKARLSGWSFDRVMLAEQARVALSDEIGEVRGAEAVLMLLGERPGLRAPHSLGAYLTYAPGVGMSDAQRNCVSNIRDGGLSISVAVTKLIYLLNGARALGMSGVALKENSDVPLISAEGDRENLNKWRGLLHASAGLLQP